MTFVSNRVAPRSSGTERVSALNRWRMLTDQRLTEVFDTARVVPFDCRSRIVLLGDCHRGDGGPTDVFAKNAALFTTTLHYYCERGFTYVEVGDGDELWKNGSMSKIRTAYSHIFDLLRELDRESRLHLISGNHEVRGSRFFKITKDGIATCEGVILRNSDSGPSIFALHGHQADVFSDRLWVVCSILLRYVGMHLERPSLFGERIRRNTSCDGWAGWQPMVRWIENQIRFIEDRLLEWAIRRRQILICGHTHRPRAAVNGATAYFNTGSCISKDYLTGIEILDGKIASVKWSITRKPDSLEPSRAERRFLSIPRRLSEIGL